MSSVSMTVRRTAGWLAGRSPRISPHGEMIMLGQCWRGLATLQAMTKR